MIHPKSLSMTIIFEGKHHILDLKRVANGSEAVPKEVI